MREDFEPFKVGWRGLTCLFGRLWSEVTDACSPGRPPLKGRRLSFGEAALAAILGSGRLCLVGPSKPHCGTKYGCPQPELPSGLAFQRACSTRF